MNKSKDFVFNFNQRQRDFGYLQSLHLSRNIGDDGCSEYSINITLCDYPFYEGDQKLVISFLGVRSLKIGELEGLYKLSININDVSEDQIEGINYKVKEEENEVFSFYCAEFEFQIM